MPNHRKQLSFKDKDLWYLVGLIATDGNLSSDGRHIDITSKDLDFIEAIKRTFCLSNKIGRKSRAKGQGIYYRLQIANKNFYDFLLLVGLTPNKSLSIGELSVPTEWFCDFLRGVIDGDGSIMKWTHPSNKTEQWSLRIYSASSVFIHWLQRMIETQILVAGKIYGGQRGVFVLKYGKLAAQRILALCYKEGCVSLDRKAKLAEICNISNTGWGRSKTLLSVI